MPVEYWWVTPLIAVLTVVLGGGGVVAIRRLRLDRQLGVSAAEVAEDDALAARWQKIIEAQTESLVEPLRKRLAEVEQAVKVLEDELHTQRTKYWRAVTYIRALLHWGRVHAPGQEAPPPPAEIVEDI